MLGSQQNHKFVAGTADVTGADGQDSVQGASLAQQKFDAFLPFVGGSGIAQHFYYTGQYDRALDLINRKLETRPDAPTLHEWLGLVYEQQGRTVEAIEEFQKAISLSESIDGLGSLGHVYAVSGKFDDAKNTLRKLDEVLKHKYVSPFQKALIYAGLGQKDQALSELERAYNERSLTPVSLKCDPRLDGLRSEPRFRDFTRRVGLPG